MSSKGINPSYDSVIDLGCGTGLVGEKLKELGFIKITGLDCSEGMLFEAEQKAYYSSLEQAILGGSDPIKGFPMQLRGKFELLTGGDVIALDL